MEMFQKVALVLTIIGAINWGLIGLLDFNLVEMITGGVDMIERIIYILVGIAGLANIMLLFYHYEPSK